MILKEGIVLRPFGAASRLEGNVGKDIGEWLIKKGVAKKSDFETAKPKVKRKAKAKAAPVKNLDPVKKLDPVNPNQTYLAKQAADIDKTKK